VARKFVLLALACAWGCAQPNNPVGSGGGEDAGGSPADFSTGGGPDLTSSCGDRICNASAGENCMTCFADCGMCNCPAGYADCDGQPQNGCETPINTVSDCGGCGMKCLAVGGTNSCVQSGAGWACEATCNATHANCDGNSANGCETDLTSPASCGSCAVKCVNPNGSTACVAAGVSETCKPTCTPGWSACGAATAGCTTPTSSDVNNCGACNRACSTNNVATLGCGGGVCAPTCKAPWSDCNQPAAPGADDGCETNGTADPGEPDNTCNGQSTTTNEGSQNSYNTSRILPAGDADTYTINLIEGSHVCLPLTSQNYWAVITLNAPSGNLTMNFKSSNISTCDNTWGSQSTSICTHWTGTCGATDNLTTYVQVVGVNAAALSCNDYSLSVHYCSEGDHCGCP
jgi:hypothetical protein